jgi:hypothetical protein
MGLTLIAVLAFVLLNPLISQGIPFLPRYYIALLPPVLAGILSYLYLRSPRLAIAAASILVLAFAINVKGLYYAYSDHPTYVLAERSLAYRDLLDLQIEDIALLTDLSLKMPVYYDYFGFYRLEYPELGYGEGPLPSGVSVFHNRELADANLADLPQRFAFVFEYPVLGGETLLRIWNEAEASEADVMETVLTRGNYTVYVIEVDMTSSSIP